jgi:hypothetical protein
MTCRFAVNRNPPPRVGAFGEFVEDSWPMLGGERALIDAIDEGFAQGPQSGGGRLMT